MRSCEHVACWLAMSSCHARTCDYQEKNMQPLANCFCIQTRIESIATAEGTPLYSSAQNAAARLRLCRENDLCTISKELTKRHALTKNG